jgi:phenylacetate-CoA ligase
MMYEPEIEAAPWQEQIGADEVRYRRQVAYLFERSRFYREKLTQAGFADADAVGGLADIARLPLTEKDELRASRSAAEPIGSHLAAPMADLLRIYSTSGTTGTPSFVPLTRRDLAGWVKISSRSYSASGLQRGDRLLSTYNAGPFVAGAALDAFNELGVTHVPVGSGNSDRLMNAIRLLKPTVMAMTPSYALHLAEWARDRGIDAASTSIERVMVAGEPGGGEPAMREKLEQAWNAKVTEAMGIGDIAVSLWGECPAQQGMHFGGRGLVHFELIEPETGKALPLADGMTGELVYTHLDREAAPLLRFRSRDHVQLWTGPCACGRTAPRIRCVAAPTTCSSSAASTSSRARSARPSTCSCPT